MKDRIIAEINLKAICDNLRIFKEKLPEKTKILAVIKANAYGHGAVAVADEISDIVSFFGVATASEAVELYNAEVRKPILILGPVSDEELVDLIPAEIRIPVFDLESAKEISEMSAALHKKAIVHIPVDTGMSRIGVSPDLSGAEIVKAIQTLPNIEIEGVFSHFAKADSGDLSDMDLPLRKMNGFLSLLEKEGVTVPIRHISNSAAAYLCGDHGFDMVRLGILMYGIRPDDAPQFHDDRFREVLRLRARITYVKTVPKGTEISYGGTYVTECEKRIGTVSAGYADGIPRSLSGRGEVLVKGKRAKILGRICMDQLMIDLTGIDGVRAGDEAVLIGKSGDQEITVLDFEKASGRFRYEIPCLLTERVTREYISE